MLIDNHCHLEEISRAGNLVEEMAAAAQVGVSQWQSCALSRAEIVWHQQNRSESISWSAGIHPCYEPSRELEVAEICELAEQHEITAIGEIGLDKRNKDINWQKKILLEQLEIAKQNDLPVIFHVVKSYYELYKLIKDNFPQVRGYLHGFNSSEEVFRKFCEFDIGFSMNARMPADNVVRNIVKRGLWQIETDAPYGKPPGVQGKRNRLCNLVWVKKKIEAVTGHRLWK